MPLEAVQTLARLPMPGGRLVANGLIQSYGEAGRTTHLQLTDRGRHVAEALSGAPTLADGHALIVQLLDFAPAGTLISELLPAALKTYAGRGFMEKLSVVQTSATPAAVAGWLESDSDCEGRAAYRVTFEGAAAAKLPAPPLPETQVDDALNELFWQVREDERQRLRTIDPPDPADISPLPLSCGAWDEIVGPWTRKPRRKKPAGKGAKE